MEQHLSESSQEQSTPATKTPWHSFISGEWQRSIDVRDFIIKNVTPHEGDETFLAPPTVRTQNLFAAVTELVEEEKKKGGVLDVDASTPTSITAHGAGYIDRALEKIVGLQTDKPLRRAIVPNGGLRMVLNGLKAYGFPADDSVTEFFEKHRKTHNEGVFDAYTPEIMKCRKSAIITGLPDAYGRGRIIGDYRRLALYGLTRLIEDKKNQRSFYDTMNSTEEVIRSREELAEQARALGELGEMAQKYGYDVSAPATTLLEAAQWTYFAYLAAVKEQNGAAMSIGRISTFLDIYAERDLKEGVLNEQEAQEIIDDLVIKLRLVRFLRTPEYDALFSGDPTWVTESIGGMALDGRTLVTKTSFRFLHTLTNLSPAPEPNLTVLWSEQLPEGFKQYCSRVSIRTSSIQYENDDLMRPYWGDDYGIACCVSAMRIGKQMQFFGARANLAKTLLYAINGGRDEISGEQIGPMMAPLSGETLDYDQVQRSFDRMMDWLAGVYVNALNSIHYMHDKYHYERLEFALHDREIYRTLACGIAGLSVVADSLSAIKYAKVTPIRDASGLATDFTIEGQFPRFGNHDDRVDSIAVEVVESFMKKLQKLPTYRNAVATQSVLTITSNVVYGKSTGTTPDGRKRGEPFAPGCNPMHQRDVTGFIASALSVAKIPYRYALDGISYTASLVPSGMGPTESEQVSNLAGCLDAYFAAGGHHINVNVLSRETLLDAMEHPGKYPQLTIRVSGYAVNFVKLTREQQLDVVNRTFHQNCCS